MAGRPTILDVARAASVSPKTVSRVVNGQFGVKDETASRVREAIQELDFRLNDVARSLRPGQRSGMLGMVIGDLANPFYALVAAGVEEVARANQNLVLMSSSQDDADLEHELVNALCRKRVDGMLIVPTGTNHDYLIPEIDAGMPFVFIDRPAKGIPGDVVVIENRASARSGVEHLISKGHRRIGMIGDAPWLHTAIERRAGYVEALNSAGIAVDDDLIRMGTHDPHQAERRAGELLASADPPTAIFAGNNRICIGTLRAVNRSHHHIAVVGFDDMELVGSLSLSVPLTLMVYDPAELGRRAAQLLFDRLAGDASVDSQYVQIPTTLVEYSPNGASELSAKYNIVHPS